MNTEELAFVNRQLAGMLQSGIPLEVGLKKITESMSDAKLKGQLAELGERLEKGQAIEQAVEGLDLPETYKRLLVLGQADRACRGAHLRGRLLRAHRLADHPAAWPGRPVLILLAAWLWLA